MRVTTKKPQLKYQTPKIMEILRQQGRKESRQIIQHNFSSSLSNSKEETSSHKKEKGSRKYSSVLKNKVENN
jgi:hypothetical protein